MTRVQRFDATAEDGGVGGEVFHSFARKSDGFNELVRTACGDERNSFFVQFFEQCFKSVFVEN